MAAPSTTNEVTVRRLSSIITGIWDKCKNMFQTKLTAQTAYSGKGTATKVPQITTNSLGQVTGITEVDISVGGFPILTSSNSSGSPKYWKLGTTKQNAQGWGAETFLIYGDGDIGLIPYIWYICIKHRQTVPTIRVQRVGGGSGDNTAATDIEAGCYLSNASDGTYTIFIKRPSWYPNGVKVVELAHDDRFTLDVGYLSDTEPSGADYSGVQYFYVPAVLNGRSMGNPTTPVYIDGNNRFQACNTSSMSVGTAAIASNATAVGPYSAFDSPAAAYGFSRLGTVIFASSSKKGLMTFRVHASRSINEVYVLHGEFGRNDRSEITSRFMVEGPDGPLYKLCYKDVSDSTNPKYEIWLVDTAATGSLERRVRIELISVDISGFDRNFASQQTNPGSLIDFWKSAIDAYIPSVADKGDSSGNNRVFAHWTGNNVTSVTPSSSQARTGTKWLVAGYTESDGTHFNVVDVNNVTVKNAQQINGYNIIVGQLGTSTGTIYFV